MKRILLSILGSAVMLIVVSAAMAQSTDPASGDKSTPSASTKAPETPPTEATPAPDAAAQQKNQATPAADAGAKVDASAKETAAVKSNPEMDKVKERGMKASAKERADVDKKLDEIEKQIENETIAKGDATVAGRISGEFGMTADALTAERSQYSRGWGELLVAHTILANTKAPITMADVFQARSQGTGWGVIAAGLDLKLGEVVNAVRTEGRVAAGLAKGDGKPAMIQSNMEASAGANAKGAVKTPKAKAGVAAGAGVGAGVDLKGATGK
jgi:hypothetical protein